MFFWTAIENQFDGTSHSMLYWHYDDENQAYSKYFTICVAAAISPIPYHAAILIRSDGNVVEQRVWDRRTSTPETIEE